MIEKTEYKIEQPFIKCSICNSEFEVMTTFNSEMGIVPMYSIAMLKNNSYPLCPKCSEAWHKLCEYLFFYAKDKNKIPDSLDLIIGNKNDKIV